MSLVTEKDATRIEEAVARLEQRSAAELVVAVVPKSGNYAEWRALVAGCWTLGSALLLLGVFPEENPVWLVLAELPLGLFFWLVLGWPPLHRYLVPRRVAERSVQARAFELFAERGLHHTRDATGILLFISELERRVTLLGDRAIDALVGADGWQRHVDHLIRRIHEHKTAEGVLEVISELEGLLSQTLPLRPDDTDELPNAIVRKP